MPGRLGYVRHWRAAFVNVSPFRYVNSGMSFSAFPAGFQYNGAHQRLPCGKLLTLSIEQVFASLWEVCYSTDKGSCDGEGVIAWRAREFSGTGNADGTGGTL